MLHLDRLLQQHAHGTFLLQLVPPTIQQKEANQNVGVAFTIGDNKPPFANQKAISGCSSALYHQQSSHNLHRCCDEVALWIMVEYWPW
jgi:hypothetical protein